MAKPKIGKCTIKLFRLRICFVCLSSIYIKKSQKQKRLELRNILRDMAKDPIITSYIKEK